MSTSLKETINKRIINDIILECKNDDYKVFILDRLATKIISSCCKMVDIMSENIMIIEDLHKKRQPMPRKDAIYFLSPTDKSVRDFLADWPADKGKQMYKNAHLFFTDRVPHDLFHEIATSHVSRFIKKLKEINISFIACEKRIFELDQPDAIQNVYSPDTSRPTFVDPLERIADQLSTVCATLGEYPSVRYYRNSSSWSGGQHGDHCERLANLVLQKLNAFKADEPEIGESSEKHKSQLIILDRSFDVVTPLLHELTYQAMVSDLVCKMNKSSTDVYCYEKALPNGEMKKVEVPLDEDDELWVKYRHNHIAQVSSQIPEAIKKFSQEKKINALNKTGKQVTIRELTATVRKMPQYQKELTAYECHFHLAEQSMVAYNGNVEELCQIEQDLAMGEDIQYQKIKDSITKIVPSLLNDKLNAKDKIRIILLYILYKGGINQENLTKLCERANLDAYSKGIIQNFAKLGIPLFNGSTTTPCEAENGVRGVGGGAFQRKNRQHQIKYSISRWTPAVKDVIEQAIENKLDPRQFPYLNDRRDSNISMAGTGGSRGRNYNWHKSKASSSGSRIIVFVLGGMSASEMRTAYEVSDMFLPKDVNGNVIQTPADDPTVNSNRTNRTQNRPALSARQQRNTGRDIKQTSNNAVSWEVLLGSTHRLVPESFLNEIGDL